MSEILEKDDINSPVPVRAASLYYRSCINSGNLLSVSDFIFTS